MTVARVMFDNRNGRSLHDRPDQALAATGNYQVDISASCGQGWNERPVGLVQHRYALRRQPRFAQACADGRGDGEVGVDSFLPAAENARVAALDAQASRVCGNIWPRFKNNPHHADRHAPFLDSKSVWPVGCGDSLANRVDLACYLLQRPSHALDPRVGQRQPVHHSFAQT